MPPRHHCHPDTIVNSRIGNELGEDHTLGDMAIPRLPRPDRRESVDTHKDSWGHAANGINFKSARGIVPRLVQVVAKNGVSMLNVGPDGKGRIPAPSVRVLAEVGQWINRHEAAIFGSVRTPLAPLPWGECTTRGTRSSCARWIGPRRRRLVVPGLQSRGTRARLENARVPVRAIGNGVLVQLPPSQPFWCPSFSWTSKAPYRPAAITSSSAATATASNPRSPLWPVAA